jgi:hypothetical protein
MRRDVKKTPGIIVGFALLAAGTAAAQEPSAPARTPAQKATPQQPAERPALNLRLDSAERRPAVTFTPRDADNKKQDAAQSLPGLGGKPSKALNESDPTTVIPVTNDNIE